MNLEQAKYDPIDLHVLHSHLAGLLFDFMGWLTTRKERLTLSSADNAVPAIEAIREFAKLRGLHLEDAQVETWQAILASPQQPEQEAVKLDEVEQYRIQMAGISTAAIGYWREGDPIHPDYDTPALRDVAKLYAKYETPHKSQQKYRAVNAVHEGQQCYVLDDKDTA